MLLVFDVGEPCDNGLKTRSFYLLVNFATIDSKWIGNLGCVIGLMLSSLVVICGTLRLDLFRQARR